MRWAVITGDGKLAYGPASAKACNTWAWRAMRERGGAYFVVPASAAPKRIRVKGNSEIRSLAKLTGKTATGLEGRQARLQQEIDSWARGISARAAKERTNRKQSRPKVRPYGKRDV